MISYGKQTIDQSDIDSVIEVLRSDWLTQGSAVEKFELDLKNYFGAKYSSAVSSGTAALHLTALALEWKPGDVVITSPITFLATVNCIVYAGATPDFADINPLTYTIDPNRVEDKIKSLISKNKNVKAIIGVDYAGHPCDWKSLREISNKYELQLVNDNCHALGAAYYNDKQYAVANADVVIQSYHPVKNITTGEGGAVLTNNVEVDEKVRLLRTHGITKDPNQLEKNDGAWYYEMQKIGFNYRITDFQSALGSSQLIKLDLFNKKRKQIADNYETAFSKIEYINTPKVIYNIKHAYHLYAIQIDFNKIGEKKSEFFNKMKNSGINLQVHYIPVHIQPFYRKKFGFVSNDFPISVKFYQNELSLPIYPNLSNENQQKVIETIVEYFNN